MAFDIFSYAAGATHPTDTVVINTDRATAYRVAELENKLDKQHRLLLEDSELEALEKENAELREVLKKNEVVMTLRGLTSDEKDEIDKAVNEKYPEGDDSQERNDELDARTFAKAFVKAVDSEGEVDERSFYHEKGLQILRNIPDEMRSKVIQTLGQLLFRSNEFELVDTSASFS